MRRAEGFRDGGREVQQRAAPLSITAKTNSPDRRQSPSGLPLRIVLWPNAKFSSRVPRESGNCTLHAAMEVPMAKKAKKSTKKKPAGKSSAKRRKASKGVLAGTMATVHKQARKLGI